MHLISIAKSTDSNSPWCKAAPSLHNIATPQNGIYFFCLSDGLFFFFFVTLRADFKTHFQYPFSYEQTEI